MRLTLALLLTACTSQVHLADDAGPPARADAGEIDAAPAPSDAGAIDAGEIDAGEPIADAGIGDAGVCGEGLVADGAHCIGWRVARPPQRCQSGQPALMRSSVVLPWTVIRLVAITCEGELPQLYFPEEDRWERWADVTTTPLTAPDLPTAPDSPTIVAAAQLTDGTRVGISGSLHAAPPYATWLADPGATAWRPSIEAPSVWIVGAAAVADDKLLFVGDETFLFVRSPR